VVELGRLPVERSAERDIVDVGVGSGAVRLEVVVDVGPSVGCGPAVSVGVAAGGLDADALACCGGGHGLFGQPGVDVADCVIDAVGSCGAAQESGDGRWVAVELGGEPSHGPAVGDEGLEATFRAGAVHEGGVLAAGFDLLDALRRLDAETGSGRRGMGGQQRVEGAAADAGAGGNGGEADAGVEELGEVGPEGFGIGVGMPLAVGDGAAACLLGGSVGALAGGALAPVLCVAGSGAVSVSVPAAAMWGVGGAFAVGISASGTVVGVHGVVRHLCCRPVTPAWLSASRIGAEGAGIRSD